MAQFFIPANGESVSDIPFEVVDFLARLSDEYTVFFNAHFKRQADIIVFSKHAAHVIEVKDKRGTIVVDQDDKWYVDGEPIVNVFAKVEENPRTQAKNTARAFEEELRRIYRRYGRKFNGKVFPYVLVPFANEASRSNLSQIRERERWVWILASFKDLPNVIARRDEYAVVKEDFAFAPEDIELIVQAMRMKPVGEICGVRVLGGNHSLGEVGSTPHHAPYHQPSEDHLPRGAGKREQIRPRHAPVLVASVGVSALIGAIGLCVLLAIAFLLWEIRSNREFPSPSPVVSVPSAVPSQTTISVPTKPALSSSPAPPSSTVTGEWSASRNGLILTIEKVELGTNSFRIWMRATNNTNTALTLPLYGCFFVVDNLGNQYEADPFSSTFPKIIAPGATVSGSAKMNPHLDDDATSITVVFTHVYGSLSIDSIKVENIPVP